MANIDEIMDRIKERNNLIGNKRNNNNNNNKDKKSNIGMKFSLYLMSIFAILLAFMIYAKKDENGAFLKEKFGIEVNFAKINKEAKNLLDKFMVFKYDFVNKNDDLYVGLNDSYIELDENEYYNSTYKVYSIGDGVVSFVNENTIIIEQDNGVIAKYLNVLSPLVYRYDRVEEYQIIGSINETIKMFFYRDGKLINYEKIYD